MMKLYCDKCQMEMGDCICVSLPYMDLARKAAALLPRERDQGDGEKVEINVPPQTTHDAK